MPPSTPYRIRPQQDLVEVLQHKRIQCPPALRQQYQTMQPRLRVLLQLRPMVRLLKFLKCLVRTHKPLTRMAARRRDITRRRVQVMLPRPIQVHLPALLLQSRQKRQGYYRTAVRPGFTLCREALPRHRPRIHQRILLLLQSHNQRDKRAAQLARTVRRRTLQQRPMREHLRATLLRQHHRRQDRRLVPLELTLHRQTRQ